MMSKNQKFAFISIIGNVNAGKSSLMNSLVDYKSSIVTHKRHTTIQCTRGIMTIGDTQIVLIDTPGYDVVAGSSQMKIGIQDSDLLMIVIDSAANNKEHVMFLLDGIKHIAKPKFVVLNKIDLVNKPQLLPMIDYVSNTLDCQDVFLTSVSRNVGLDQLRDHLLAAASVEDHHYQADQKVDMTTENWAAEMTRESLLLFLHDEIPYNVSVLPEYWLEDDKQVIIKQTIVVPKITYRQVLLGANGQKIKLIGTRTRREVQNYFGKNVSIYLYVKVKHRNY